MGDLDTFGLERAMPIKPGRANVKDLEFQIHVPTIGDAKKLENTSSFKNVLGGYMEEVNTLQHEADAQIQRLAAGETEDIHEVTLAMDEADNSFQLMMELRNRLVDAYREVMRMQT
jgi:flagellar hook-basal body complex protein FliE